MTCSPLSNPARQAGALPWRHKRTPASATNTPGAVTILGKDKNDGTHCRS